MKNQALNKEENQSFSLFCNQNYSIVIFHHLKGLLLCTIFSTKQKMVTPLGNAFSPDENAVA